MREAATIPPYVRQCSHRSLGYQDPLSENGRGRPRYLVTEEQLLSHGFAVPAIAQMLGMSVSTVRRRMTEYGLLPLILRSLHDIDLDATDIELKQEHPNCGYRLLDGYLKARGVRFSKPVSVKHCRGVILTTLLYAG